MPIRDKIGSLDDRAGEGENGARKGRATGENPPDGRETQNSAEGGWIPRGGSEPERTGAASTAAASGRSEAEKARVVVDDDPQALPVDVKPTPPKPKRAPAKPKRDPLLSEKNIERTLSVLSQGLASIQPSEFVDLYTIPDDELELISRPLAFIAEDLPPAAVEKVERYGAWLLLLFGIFMVYGLRVLKQNEIISARKKANQFGYSPTQPDNREGPETDTRNGAAAGGQWGSGRFN